MSTFDKIVPKDCYYSLEISQEKKTNIPSKSLIEEDCNSLWQYCIHDNHYKASPYELLLPISLVIFYFTSFYCIIVYLQTSPIVDLSNRSNKLIIYLNKWFFTLFLFIQAEAECFDAWRMLKFADGHDKKILFFGMMQYLTGCFVEIVSYSLINRSVTIFNIMVSSAILTVFLRIDDVIVSFIHKFFPDKKKKVAYDKAAFDKDPRKFIYWSMGIKLGYFILSEIFDQLFGISIYI